MSSREGRPSRGRQRPRLRSAAALAAAALVLAGCAGYRPLYALDAETAAVDTGNGRPANAAGGAATVAEALKNIEVGRIAEREGQILRELLIERLDTGGGAGTWPLNIVLRISRQDLGIQRDASATRANLIATATVTLTDPDDTVRLSRSINVITSFSILDDQFASLVAERNARDRALDALADRIRTQLALYFARPAEPEDDGDPSGTASSGTGKAGTGTAGAG